MMVNFFARLSGLVRFGQPADFCASKRMRATVQYGGVAAVLLLACLPFIQPLHEIPVTTWQTEWLTAAIGLFLVIPLAASDAWRTFTVPWVILAPLSIAVLATAHALLDPASRSAAELYALEMAWAIVVLLGASALVAQNPLRTVSALRLGLIVAGAVGALLGIVQAIRLPAFAHLSALYSADGFAMGFLGQRNLFGNVQTIAVFALCTSPWFFRSSRQSGPSVDFVLVFGAALMVLLVASLALAGSNAIYAYLAWGLIFGWWTSRRCAGQDRSLRAAAQKLWRASLFALCAVVVIRGGIAAFGGPTHALPTATLGVVWKDAWHLIRAHPFSGIGIGETPISFYHLVATLPNTEVFSAFHKGSVPNAHNIILQLWLDFGVVGPLVAAFLGWRFIRAGATADTTERIFAVGALGVLALQSCVEFPLWEMPFLSLALLFFAVADTGFSLRRMPGVAMLPVPAWALASLVGLVVMQMGQTLNALQPIFNTPFSAVNVAKNATNQAIVSEMLGRKTVATDILKPIIFEAQNMAPLPYILPDLAAQRAQGLAVLMRFEPSPNVAFMHAEALAFAGDSDAAVKALDEAQRAYPIQARVWQRNWQQLTRARRIPALLSLLHGFKR